MPANCFRYAVGIVEQREDVGVGQQSAQRLDDFLAAAHIQKPIMDNCNAHSESPTG